MSDWIEQEGRKYYAEGYVNGLIEVAKRRGDKLAAEREAHAETRRQRDEAFVKETRLALKLGMAVGERNRARIDVRNLIAILRGHEENRQEFLEDDDAAVVADIGQRTVAFAPATEHKCHGAVVEPARGGPVYPREGDFADPEPATDRCHDSHIANPALVDMPTQREPADPVAEDTSEAAQQTIRSVMSIIEHAEGDLDQVTWMVRLVWPSVFKVATERDAAPVERKDLEAGK